jgi:SAM-dependent methyltransferase
MNENEAALRETILTYDNGARAYGQIFQNVDMSKYMNDFVDHLPRAGIVLDNGCGTGRDLEQFLRRGIRTVGLDRSASMLAECPRDSSIALVQGDLRNLPFAEESLSGVWQCASLLHLSPTDAQLSLCQVRWVLEIGGVLFLSTAAGIGSEWKSGRLGGRRRFHYYTKDDVLQMLCNAGLQTAWIQEEPGVVQGKWINALAMRS